MHTVEKRTNLFSRSRPPSPQRPKSPQSHSSVQEDGGIPGTVSFQDPRQEGVLQASSNDGEGRVPPRLDSASDAAAAAVREAKVNLEAILHEKRKSDESINVQSQTHTKEQEQAPRPSPRPEDATLPAQLTVGFDCVPAAPPSELKYGDRLRLWVR